MCTYPTPSTGPAGFANTVFDKPALELKDQQKKQMASELFSSLQHIYKSWDYRCLVPESHPDPEKWRTYDMHGYRTASNQAMYDKVDTFKFDVNFNNWISPKVLAKFARRPRKAWKRAYGFPYTTGVHWDGRDINTGDASPCWWRCAKLVLLCFFLHSSQSMYKPVLCFVNLMLSYLRPMENVRCQFNSHVPFCLELVHFIYFGLLRHFWPPHNLIAFVGDHKICKSLREQWWLLQVLHHSVHPQHLRNCSQQTYPGRLSLDKCYMSRFLKEYIFDP